MQNWRWWLLGFLTAAPFVVLMGIGAFQLWWSGHFIWAWWPLAGCLVLAFFLAWRWQRARKLLTVDFTPALHWTERDRQAWQLVEQRAQNVPRLSTEQMTSLSFYVDTARDLANELARVYHPSAKDPIANLTIIEILGVVELATHDLALLMEKYVPASHLLTINNWRQAQKAVGWYQSLSTVGWLVAGVLNPIATGARYLGTQVGINQPWRKLQSNLQAWFYTSFLQRLGSYLIEVYGGRLRRGAMRYRQLFGTPSGPPVDTQGDSTTVQPVTIVVLGQTKTGKSSLVNALIGERKADTDVVAATPEITRYEVHPKELDSRLVLLDTVGYANEGARADQLRATEHAARDADVMLLVLHARNPARQADLDVLRSLVDYFQANPNLKKPPVVGVLTHIDLLSPSLEWQPPYDWMEGTRGKEKSIAAALAAVQEQLGDYLIGVVPVCSAPGKEYGIQEAVLPALASLLDEARAVALVRCLKAEADSGKVQKVFSQLLAAGTELFKTLWSSKR